MALNIRFFDALPSPLLEGVESNFTRSKGYGHSLYVIRFTNRVNLDANNTDYLEQSFDGRTVG